MLALSAAARGGHLECVKVLLDNVPKSLVGG